MPLGLFETFWFFELNKCQLWCFECFVSETLNCFFCRDLKANTDLSVCHGAVGSLTGRENIIKKAPWPSHLRCHLELKTLLIPAISTKTFFLLSLNHFGLSMAEKLSWSFCYSFPSARGSSETPPQTAVPVLTNLWKPKPANLGSDAPYSECVWEGRDRDMSSTGNCCFHNLTTSSKPVPNSVWPTRVAGFFSKFG